MKDIVIDILLALALASAWLGAIGFARLRSSMDRLHCATFITLGAGLPIVVAAFVADGPSQRAFKILLLFIVAFVAGASVNQAIARAVFTRDEVGERM